MNDVKNLRGLGMGALVGALAIAGLVGLSDLSTPLRADGEAGAATKDVVLVRCKTAGQRFLVSGYQGSVATPARKSDSCADTLSDLVKAGFGIAEVGYNDDAEFVLYTITR